MKTLVRNLFGNVYLEGETYKWIVFEGSQVVEQGGLISSNLGNYIF